MISKLDLTTNTTESNKQGASGEAQNRPNESWEMIESNNGKIIERNMEDSEDSDEVPDEMDDSPAGGHQGRISVGPQTPMNHQRSMSSPGQQLNDITNTWRRMPLSREITIQSVHPHVLTMCKTIGKTFQNASRTNQEHLSEIEKENASWLCNGSVVFQDGCKGGLTEFDLHPELNAWRCFAAPTGSEEGAAEGDDCDFDMCEMCIRWTLHCDKSGNDLGLA